MGDYLDCCLRKETLLTTGGTMLRQMVPGCRRKLFKHEPVSKPASCVPWPKQLWQSWQMPTYVSWERRIVLFSLVAFAAVFQLDTR